MLLNLGKSFFFDGRDYDLVSLSAGGVEHQHGKTSVAGDEPEFLVGHQRKVHHRATETQGSTEKFI